VYLPNYAARPSFSVQWSQPQRASTTNYGTLGRTRASSDARSAFGTMRGSIGGLSADKSEERQSARFVWAVWRWWCHRGRD